MGKTPGEIFAANAYRWYLTLFAFFHLHHILDEIPTWKLLTLTFMEKSKGRKMCFGKEDEKTRLSKIANVLKCDASPGKS